MNLINERARLVQEIGQIKENQGVFRYDPVRERKMLDIIKENNDGPFDNATIDHIFKFHNAELKVEYVRVFLLIKELRPFHHLN